MQVNAKVNESRIRLIEPGMPALVRVEALDGAELRGVVRKVFAYANRSRWSSSSVKEFSVIVDIENPPAGLRTGSSAEVRIRANQLPDELMVPVQAVLEHNGKHYCLWKSDAGWQAKPVTLGYSNDSFVVINKGLTEQDKVVLNPRNYLDEIDLPELKGKEIEAQEMLVGVKPLTPNQANSAPGTLTNASADGGAPGGNSPGGNRPGGMLQSLDKDGDGKISQAEAPERMQARFSGFDKNGDGFLDAAELAALPRTGGRPQGQGGPPGGGPSAGGAQ
jgi:hypothetical protein